MTTLLQLGVYDECLFRIRVTFVLRYIWVNCCGSLPVNVNVASIYVVELEANRLDFLERFVEDVSSYEKYRT